MAARICKEEGCARPARGRGMCINHYEEWRYFNRGVTVMASNERSILDAMPATRKTIMEVTGLGYGAVQRALAVLMSSEPRRAHIEDWQEPTTMGTKWLAIYAAGPGEDAVLTDKRKLEHHRRGQRAAHARRMAAYKAVAVGTRGRWAATLLGGTKAQREYLPSMRNK